MTRNISKRKPRNPETNERHEKNSSFRDLRVRFRVFRDLIFLLLITTCAWAGTRIKDVAYIQGIRSYQLIGYGLVVGLNETGDSRRSIVTVQTVASMLKRFGITVPQEELRVRNVAAVMVTATLPPFTKEGGMIDVIVSSMGDATSLQGGILLMAPLSGLDGAVYVMAQGSLSIGGYDIRTQGGTQVRKNHSATGRVPNGGIVEKSVPIQFSKDSTLSIVLLQPDFTTAQRIAEAVNAKLASGGSKVASAQDASTVKIAIPTNYLEPGKLVEFISALELLEITPDVVAKVVINERTGTIVVGGNVSILPVAVSHGNLNIEIQAEPVISQPLPLSQGKTVTTTVTSANVTQESGTVVALNGVATVQDVAKALNSLKVSPRDIISIFQALKEAGALKAELVII
jgi:flagellar P-ring protein precursor FlgI